MVLVCLLLAQDPGIESARALTEGAGRFGCWLPVEVRVRGPFDGDVVVASDAGPRFARKASVPAGATAPAVVPVALLPGRLRAFLRSGGREAAAVEVPPVELLSQDDLLVGVVGGAARVEDLGGGRRAWLFPFRPEEWADPALLEAIDVIVGDPKGAPLGLFLAQGGRVVAAADGLRDLRPAVAMRFEAVDEAVRGLLPRDPWIDTKRERAAMVLAVYFVVTLGALSCVWLGRASPRKLLVAVAGVAAVFAVAQCAVPRGRSAAAAYPCEAGTAAVTLVVLRGPAPVDVVLPRLAKPVFGAFDDARRSSMELEFGEVTSARGAALPQAFVAVEERAPRSGIAVSREVRNGGDAPARLYALVGNRNSAPFELAPGASAPFEAPSDAAAPSGEGFGYWRRLVFGDVAFGWRLTGDRELRGVEAADLAERRERPGFFIARPR